MDQRRSSGVQSVCRGIGRRSLSEYRITALSPKCAGFSRLAQLGVADEHSRRSDEHTETHLNLPNVELSSGNCLGAVGSTALPYRVLHANVRDDTGLP